jgi:hypothetical protein
MAGHHIEKIEPLWNIHSCGHLHADASAGYFYDFALLLGRKWLIFGDVLWWMIGKMLIEYFEVKNDKKNKKIRNFPKTL